MAKSQKTKKNVMRTAADLRAEYRKWLTLGIIALIVCLALIALNYFLVVNEIVPNEAGLTWILAAIAAVVLFVFFNKFSNKNREFNAYLDQHNITKDDVIEFVKTNGK